MAALAGKRVLIIEDEYFIASDLRRALERAGAAVVGPTGDLATGLSLAERQALDAAVLDVNLEGATSYAIADRLAQRAVPYLFLTGYDDWALPEAYRDTLRLSKPFQMPAVVACVQRLVAKETTR